jgi:Tfp pilus assembly protein PilX
MHRRGAPDSNNPSDLVNTLRARLKRDDGFAMVVALVVVVVVLLLAASLISSARTTSSHASQEYGRADALAAANAGLAAAVHRLSSQAEEASTELESCFTTKFVKASPCPLTESEAFANGATYRYTVSAPLTESENTCTGLFIVAPTERTVSQRCITAIGVAANGVKARVQERVADIKGSSFGVVGLFSYNNIEFTNEVTFSGEIAVDGIFQSNKTLKNKNGEEVKVKYGKEAKWGSPACTNVCTSTKMTAAELEKYKLPVQEPGPYKEAEEKAATNDKKITMTSGEINSKYEWTANNSITATIPEGTYYICKLNFNNTVKMEYTPPVKIYLDSPFRTGSKCPSGTGSFKVTNNVEWIDKATVKSPSDLKIFAWGDPKENPPSASNAEFGITNNSGGFYGEIYAPNSAVIFTNNVKMVGSIVGGSIKSTNATEIVSELGSGDESQNGTAFYGAAYHQCSPTYTESTPAKGCY